MIKTKLIKIFLTTAFFLCTNLFSETTYNIIEIAPSDCEESVAYAINDRDEVIGTCKYHDQQYVFLWNKERYNRKLCLR